MGVEEENNGTYFGITIPGFLNCERQGSLPGCLYEFDHPNRQCAPGREGEGEREGGCVGFSNGTSRCHLPPLPGTLCGECQEDYGVTFDLRFCRHCDAGGPVLFASICKCSLHHACAQYGSVTCTVHPPSSHSFLPSFLSSSNPSFSSPLIPLLPSPLPPPFC